MSTNIKVATNASINGDVKTDVPNGAKMFNRTPLQTKMEPDFDTGNLRFKARERYSFGVSDWRAFFGSAG